MGKIPYLRKLSMIFKTEIPSGTAWLALFLNIFLPGVGTMVAGIRDEPELIPWGIIELLTVVLVCAPSL